MSNEIIERENLRGSLEAAFEEHEVAAESVDSATPAEETKAERARDESGKFTKVEQAADAPVAKEGAPVVPAEVIPDEPVEQEAPQGEVKRAPSSWKKEAAAEFATLPEHVQNEILRRETDFHKGIEGFKHHADFGKRVEHALSPYQATFQKLGVDAPTAVAELMKSDDILRNAPPAVKMQKMLELAAHYGIDLNQQFDPKVAEYETRLHALQKQNEEILRSNQSRETEVVNTTLEQFAKQPGREHFDAVRGHMAALLESGQAQTLEDAYDQAVYANPSTRTVLLEQQRKQLESEVNAKRAKAASVSVKGSSPSSGAAKTQHNSVRDAIAAAWVE